MKFLSCIVLFIIVLGFNAHAQLPPLIDREMFFGDPEIAGAQISPDGKYITFLKPFHNVRNIWIKEIAQPFDQARPLTADEKRPLSSYFWSRDGKYVLYSQDKGGDENFRIYAIDPQAKGDPVPPARDLTPIEKVRTAIYDVPRKTPNEIIIGLNDRDPQVFDVYRLNLATGERTLIRKNMENILGWVTDLNGDIRLGVRQTADGGTEILKIAGDSLVSIYTVNAEEDASPVRFTPDGGGFYLETNKGKSVDKSQLELFDLKSGKTKFIEKDPENQVDFGSAYFSDVTNKLILTTYIGDTARVYIKDKKFAADYNLLKKAFPGGQLGITSMTADEQIFLVSVSTDVDPGSVYVFDRKTGKIDLLYKSRPNLPSDQLAHMKPIRYKARDGMTIPGYLTLPKGLPEKNLPTVMFIHGGPWARDFWGYSGVPQFLANRGYAVFQMNFRGSTGYGKKFLNAGNKQWGTGSMQHDITDAVQYLIKKGIADPKKIAISGGSYGGYATLAGLAFTPELYAAGFDIVGPSNIITLLNSIPPYWAPMKKTFAIRVGDMDNPGEKKMLEKQSPLFAANNIKAPLFVVQGANDPRVKKVESDQIVVALRDLGRQVEYMVAPDEGHGYAGLENRLAMFVAMEKFLSKHLNGRVQEDVRDAIRNRLDSITVNVATVTLPKAPAENASVISAMPSFDGALLQPGVFNYTMTIEARGQKIPMSLTRTLQKTTVNGAGVLRAIDEVTGMMAGADTLDLDAKTLLPIHRAANQGGASVVLSVTPTSAEGKMKMGPQEMPIKTVLTGPVVLDGANTDLALCTLPYADAYKASLSSFDVMSPKPKTLLVAVLAKEKITVGGVEYQAWKISIAPKDDDGSSVLAWITGDTRTLVKSESRLPAAAGGGTVTMELTK